MVLPEPVLAIPMMSRPLVMAGMDWAWMGEGRSYRSTLWMTSSAGWGRPN
jgi:hypothetical protein